MYVCMYVRTYVCVAGLGDMVMGVDSELVLGSHSQPS
jgi:hypothetical protein